MIAYIAFALPVVAVELLLKESILYRYDLKSFSFPLVHFSPVKITRRCVFACAFFFFCLWKLLKHFLYTRPLNATPSQWPKKEYWHLKRFSSREAPASWGRPPSALWQRSIPTARSPSSTAVLRGPSTPCQRRYHVCKLMSLQRKKSSQRLKQ